jgi:hypothetical protein
MTKSDNWQKLTLDDKMTPKKFVEEMRSALKTGPGPVRTPINGMVPPSPPTPVLRPRNEYSLEDERLNTEFAKNTGSDVSPAYEPAEGELDENSTSPAYVPSSPSNPTLEKEEEKKEEPKGLLGTIGSALGFSGGQAGNTVDSFQVGENVFFTRSTDLGFASNHVWTVAKKGGRLLTLKTVLPRGFAGGNSNAVQIAGASELHKIDEYLQWQQQRAGAIQQQQQQQAMSAMQMAGGNGGDSYGFGQPLAAPTINVTPVFKLVGGNDYSRNDGQNEQGGDGQSGGGGQIDPLFSNLVIPAKMSGGDPMNNNATSNLATATAGGSEKTIMGGLADLSKLVINKIM